MAKRSKTQEKLDRLRAKAAAHTETARAKAARKISRVRADLSVREAEIQADLAKAIGKANMKSRPSEGAGHNRSSGRKSSKRRRDPQE